MLMCLKLRKKVVIWKVVELVRLTFTLTGRVLSILFLRSKRVRKKIAWIMKPVCLTHNLCLVSFTLANENCSILLMTYVIL